MNPTLDSHVAQFLAETLLAGLPFEDFNAKIREKPYAKFSRALASPQVASLFGLERLDALLTDGALPPQQIDVIYNGWPQTLDDAQGRTGKSNPRLLADKLLCGATVRIRDLQWFDTAIDEFRRSVQTAFLARCQINMYLTPPHQAGFSPHFDSHDVFIIQCQGKKRWRIYPDYADRMPLPLSSTPFDASRYQPEGGFDELVLECGDALYIPRGVMHAAACEDRESLHLTVSLTPLTIYDVLSEALLRATRENEALRARIFSDASSSVGALQELAARISEEARQYFTTSVVESILAEHLESLRTTPNRSSALASLMRVSSLPDQNVGQRDVDAAQERIAHAAQPAK